MFFCLLLANVFWFAVTIEPVSASPGLTLKWTRNLGVDAATCVGPLAADLVGDDRLEIIVTGGSAVGGGDGTVTVLDGATGAVIWQVAPGGVGAKSPFDIADIDSDGNLEIIVSGAYPVVLNGDDGSIYWKNTAVSSYNLWSAVCDVDADGYSEIFVSSGLGPWQGYDYFTMLSYDGEILRQNPTSWHPCWGGMSIGDANFDGRFELYQGDRCYGYSTSTPYIYGEWGVRALDAHTLEPLWNDDDITCSSHCPMLADVDKDGILDVIAMHQSSSNGGIVVLNAADGSVVTTGGKYRKDKTLALACHSQPTICDIDGDGNLELITCRNSYPKIWDLYDWKLDGILPRVCGEPPKVGDVTGDGELDIIAVSGSSIYIYDKNYNQVDYVTGLSDPRAFTLVQDVDDDGLNELVVTSYAGRVYCYDTPAPAPTPRVRSELQFYSEYKQGAAEYVPPPGPLAPVISQPNPSDTATNIPVTLSQLSFNLFDYQHNLMDYTITTIPHIGSGSGTNVGNGRYSVATSNLEYGKTYTWQVDVTDGANWAHETFMFTTKDLQQWWDTQWQYRKPITIEPSQVSGDQTDFPILIDMTDSTLKDHAQLDGDDILFATLNNVKLSHEIEKYESSTGHLVAWVRIPFVSSTTFTTLYMYYGNPTAPNQEDPDAVWSTSYKLVLHLSENGDQCVDSSAYGHIGLLYGDVTQGVAGVIDGIYTFDGVNDYIQFAHSSELAGYTASFTASFWLKLDDFSTRQAILNKYDTAGNQRGWYIEFQTTSAYGKALSFFASQNGASYRQWFASFTPTADTWYYITVVWQPNIVPVFYVNGAQVATIGTDTIASIYNNAGAPLYIGRSYTTGRYLKGSLDEIRLSSPAKSASYILTSYNNQKNPSLFYHVGAEQSLPGTPIISDPNPANGAKNVPNSLSELSFNLADLENDPMDYTVITTPNIGSGSGVGVANGEYSVPISGLEVSTTYTWQVSVTDGVHATNRTFSFKTIAAEPWWNTDWQYRRTLAINPSEVSGDQTDFPVLIDLTDADLTLKAQTDGDDFVFTDADQTKLSHEIELYESSTGHLVAWIKIPLLSSTTDTLLYMYYGNPSSINQQDVAAVWDTTNKLVLHLNEETGIHHDSTVNGNNGTPYNGVIQGSSGKIDGADTFDGVNDYVQVPHSDTLSGYTQGFTVSFWVRLEDTAGRQMLLCKYNTVIGQRSWYVEYQNHVSYGRVLGFFASQDGTAYREWYAPFIPTIDTWYYVTIVWETNTVPKFYINGAQVTTIRTGTIASINNNVGVPLYIGRCTYATTRYLSGGLDEIRISNIVQSASWILTSYNSQSNPSTFYQIGTEEQQ
jgi:hypothetical protein